MSLTCFHSLPEHGIVDAVIQNTFPRPSLYSLVPSPCFRLSACIRRTGAVPPAPFAFLPDLPRCDFALGTNGINRVTHDLAAYHRIYHLRHLLQRRFTGHPSQLHSPQQTGHGGHRRSHPSPGNASGPTGIPRHTQTAVFLLPPPCGSL